MINSKLNINLKKCIGYNIDVIMPLTKNKAASIKTIEKFSKKEQISEKIDFNSYSKINFNEGNFT